MKWKLPITSRQQLQEEQQRTEDAENTLGDLQNDKEKLENELQDEKKRNEEQEAKLKELSDSISDLDREKRINESEINTMRDQLESNKQEVNFII
ncbi:hypothetical protein ACER0C_001725 [Sarotherodon galilaeus]